MMKIFLLKDSGGEVMEVGKGEIKDGISLSDIERQLNFWSKPRHPQGSNLAKGNKFDPTIVMEPGAP
jgi:hypothetical protein